MLISWQGGWIYFIKSTLCVFWLHSKLIPLAIFCSYAMSSFFLHWIIHQSSLLHSSAAKRCIGSSDKPNRFLFLDAPFHSWQHLDESEMNKHVRTVALKSLSLFFELCTPKNDASTLPITWNKLGAVGAFCGSALSAIPLDGIAFTSRNDAGIFVEKAFTSTESEVAKKCISD